MTIYNDFVFIKDDNYYSGLYKLFGSYKLIVSLSLAVRDMTFIMLSKAMPK